MKKIVVLVLMLIVGTGSLFANYNLKKGDTVGIIHVLSANMVDKIDKDHPDYNKWVYIDKGEKNKKVFEFLEDAINFALQNIGADNVLEIMPVTVLGNSIGYRLLYKK